MGRTAVPACALDGLVNDAESGDIDLPFTSLKQLLVSLIKRVFQVGRHLEAWRFLHSTHDSSKEVHIKEIPETGVEPARSKKSTSI